jgi:hypothetical protein
MGELVRSMAQRGRLRGDAQEPCRCPIFSRRAQSQSLIRECTKSSRLSQELQRNRKEIKRTEKRFAVAYRTDRGRWSHQRLEDKEDSPIYADLLPEFTDPRRALIPRLAASFSPRIVDLEAGLLLFGPETVRQTAKQLTAALDRGRTC